MKISDFSIKHPAVITILLAAVLVFGILAASGMKKDLISMVEFPSVVVVTVYPGAGPEVVEEEVTDVLEEQFSQIPGIHNLESHSGNSVSLIIIEFSWGADIDLKKNDVRDRISNAESELPEGIDGRPRMIDYSVNSLPIYSCLILSDYDPAAFSGYLDETVKPKISRIDGISEVSIRGEQKEEIVVKLYPDRMTDRGITALQIYQTLRYANTDTPGGDVIYNEENLTLRTEGQFKSISELENLVLDYRDGGYIYLKDVADVALQEKENEGYFISGGEPVVVMDIMKQSGGNTMGIIKEIRKVSAEIEKETGGMVRFVPVMDNARDIDISINSVLKSAYLGGLLAILVLFLFLHDFRTTLIIALSIPFSLLLTLAAVRLKGMSINIMTLSGMTVSIGMIVDASVVILENTHKHFRAGMSRKEAASRGASEVGGAVIASMTTSVCVFITLVVMKGFAGELLSEVAWVIVFALGASTLTAVVLVPFLSSLLLKEEREPKRKTGKFLRKVSGLWDRNFEALSLSYRKGLNWGLRHRGFILITAALLLIMSALSIRFIGFEFLTAPDMNEMELRVETPNGFSLDQTFEKMEQIRDIVEKEIPEKEADIYYTGFEDSHAGTGTVKPNRGNARIHLISVSRRDRSVQEMIPLLQRKIAENVPDVKITVLNGGLAKMLNYVTGGEGFKIEVYGSSWDSVKESAVMIQKILEQDPEVNSTDINISFDRRELTAVLNQETLNSLGITSYEAGITNRIFFNGINAGTFRDGGDSYDIRMVSPYAGKKIDEDVINIIGLKNTDEGMVNLAAVSTLETQPAVDTIFHKNKMTCMIITAYLKEADMKGIQKRVLPVLTDLSFPPGINWKVAGSADLMKDVFGDMAMALMISIFLIYMVMVIQFERFLQPFIIMGSVPFTLIGVILSLMVFRSRLTIISFFGIIALGGMVVNNAIVLVDYINLLRKRDNLELKEAVLRGAADRLKPIMITTLTTVLGILPLAFGLGEGSELTAPLGQVIGGGLITSTLITLFLIPLLYYTLEKRKERRL